MNDKLKQLKSERIKLDKEIEQLESQIKNFLIKDGDMYISIQEYKPWIPSNSKLYKVELTIEDNWDENKSIALTEEHIKDIIGALSSYVGEYYEN